MWDIAVFWSKVKP